MKRSLFLLALVCLLFARTFAAFPQIAVKPLCLDQLQSPTNITHAGDGSGRLFICEQRGQIRIFKGGMLQPTPFLDIGAKLVPTPAGYDERGLLGMAFHPDYENPASPGYRRFYLFYNGPSPDVLGTSTIGSITPGDPCTITTTTSHRLKTGARVQITGVNGGTFAPAINGTHEVTVLTPTQFTVPVNCSDTSGLMVSGARVRPSEPVDSRTFISEFLVSADNPNVANPGSERILLSFDKPQSNHVGGQIEFGPEVGPNGERYLYFGVGDGGSQRDNDAGHTGGSFARPNGNLGNGQDKTKWLGKIHRIDPLGTDGPGGQYGIPVDNPFAGQGGGIRREIYAFGLRNPWRFSFDPPTGRMFCGDVGQDSIEEIDLIVKGGNYGWHAREGTRVQDAALLDALLNGGTVLVDPAPNATTVLPGGETLIDPIGQYAHPSFNGPPVLPKIGNSVTCGYVYRGATFPALVGKYVFADWGLITPIPNGTMLGLEETAPDVWEFSQLDVVGGNPIPTHVAAFGVDEAGEIYLATKTNTSVTANDPDTGLPAGGLYMIVPPSQASVTIGASRDNAIFEDLPGESSGRGDLSAGLSPDNLSKRRALLAFDLTHALPRGVTLLSAEFGLTALAASPGEQAFSVHALHEDWGEGTSSGTPSAPAQPGDATWVNAFFDSTFPIPWSTAGASFNATASASTLVAGGGAVAWNSPGILDDVNAWLADPSTNFGWLVRDESESSGAARVRSFGSRENSNFASRPRLTLTYSGPDISRREHWLQRYFFIGQFVDDLGDGDGDTVVELMEYALNLSPLAADVPGEHFTVVSNTVGTEKAFTIAFRRDPRATDLIYQLQTSDDLVEWMTLAQSEHGAPASGAGFVSEEDLDGALPIKRVTARRTVAAQAQPAFRLQVLRFEGAAHVQTAALTMNPTATEPPALAAPATGGSVRNPIGVSFTLPRSALSGSVKLTFDDGNSVRALTLASSQESVGAHSFNFNPADPAAAAEIDGGEPIPDGVYTVTLAYQDSLGNPPASDFQSGVTVDTVPPSFTTPEGGYTPAIISAGPLPSYVAQSMPSADAISVAQSPAPGFAAAPGKVTVLLSATDAAGNEGTTSFDLVVRPATALHRKVIATGEAAPDAGSLDVPGAPPTGATVTSFGPPCIDDIGSISYLAKWTSPSGRGAGLFQDDGCLLAVGGEAAPIPDARINSLTDPVGSSGNVALLAALSGVPKANRAAVLSNADGSAVPRVIAQSGTNGTPDGARFKAFKGVAIAGSYTAFLAQLAPGTGSAPRTNAANDLGLWIKFGADPLVLALREGQVIGTDTIKTIVSFAAGSGSAGQGRGWLRETPATGARLLALVIFKEAGAQALVEVDPANVGAPFVLSRTGRTNDVGSPSIDNAAFASYGLPAAGSGGRRAFLGSLAVNSLLGVTRGNARGIFADDGSEFTPLARVGSNSGVSENAAFSLLKDPIVSDDGGIAFLATLRGGNAKGLAATTIWWQPPVGNLRLLAQGGAPAAEIPDAQWKSFTSLAVSANRGPLVVGTLVPGRGGVNKKNSNAVWAMDFEGNMRLLFRAGVTEIDRVSGMKTIKGFTVLKAMPGSVGVTRSFNDSQQVVWLATFADKSQAIVNTEVP